jgi:type VI secretion system secreted protein VgrG
MSRLPSLQLHITFDDGPEADWEVLGLTLSEGIGTLYAAQVDIETEELHADLGALLGATCELVLQRGEHPPRFVYGVVTRVDYLGLSEHHLRARLELGPAFALARQRTHSRIWQDSSVQDIVREVLANTLDDYGRSVELGHLQRATAPRDYCVQYRESDFDFVCRLLEEEGISWLFVHDSERRHEVLTLCDDNKDYPRYANTDTTALLPVIAHNPEEAELESLQAFEWARELTPTTVALSEFDAASPGSVALDESGQPDARDRSRRVYDHADGRLLGAALGLRAQDYEQALRMAGSLATCRGNAALLGPGCQFTLEGVELEGTPSEWIVTHLIHHCEAPAEGARVYHNTLRCIPAEVPIRPLPSTAKPRVLGPQTATVVGGGEIDTDAQGRIQVQFHWQEDPSFAAGASCRVRCAQSWAGPGWGAQFIPRVGMEVVVEFLDGNPDRPLVTGCVYNGGAEPPFALPGNSTQSGWRSNSSPGGGGSNELRFEDAAGSEEIYIHGQKDWTVEINHDTHTTIANDEVRSVGHDRETSIQNDQRERVGGSQNIAVAADHVETIGASMTLTVGEGQHVSVGQDQSVSVGQTRAVTVGDSATETVTKVKSVTVGGALATIVGGAMNTSVGAACAEEVAGLKTIAVGAGSSESVVGSKTVDAASITHTARKDMSLSAGQGASISAGADLAVDAGGKLSVRGKKAGLLELDEALTIKVGKAAITLKKNGEIVLDGVKISVKGKKSITLKSKKVNQN